jgi:Bax protein
LSLQFTIPSGCTREQEPPETRKSPQILTAATHGELKSFFAARNYAWDSVNEGVPSFILETLPTDLSRISRISEKKEIFFLSLLPMVLLANEAIGSQRKLLESLIADSRAGKAVTEDDRQWAIDLAAEYGIEEDPLGNARTEILLLQRLDIIPPSLVLAQAATESGFGTSYVAQNRNNLFGEFSYAAEAGDSGGERKYRLRHFPNLYDSVRAYMKNLNTHSAYILFRIRRADQRRQGRPLVGSELAVGLTAYSVRGEAYIRDIQKMMRQNRLSLLASVNLRTDMPSPETIASDADIR